jgi:ABC-2 type transport system permease protein
MISDILAVMWKERKGFLGSQGGRWRALLGLVSPVFLAIYLPWNTGLNWLQGFPSLLICMIVPIVLLGITVPDSFAGERERHTLPTLLASRLPDKAILLGKLFGALIFGLAGIVVALILGLVVANASDWQGHVVFYRPIVLSIDILAGLLVALLTGTAGILISLRSATAQGASQALISMFLVPPMILGFVLMLFREQVRLALERLDFMQTLGAVLGIIALLDIVLLSLAVTRFRRSRLIAR